MSGVGNAHWVTSQFRVDRAFDVNALQRRQNDTTIADLRRLDGVIADKPDVALTIRPVKGTMALVAWTDSALYGSTSELLDEDVDLTACVGLWVRNGRFL